MFQRRNFLGPDPMNQFSWIPGLKLRMCWIMTDLCVRLNLFVKTRRASGPRSCQLNGAGDTPAAFKCTLSSRAEKNTEMGSQDYDLEFSLDARPYVNCEGIGRGWSSLWRDCPRPAGGVNSTRMPASLFDTGRLPIKRCIGVLLDPDSTIRHQ